MNTGKIIQELQRHYPNKTIVQLPSDDPSEIICEVEPTSAHPERSVVIAVIDQSEPHVHKQSTETYYVLKGKLTLYKSGKEYVLAEGDTHSIYPGQIHAARGSETWVKVVSEPGWIPEDHLLVPDGNEAL